MGGSKLLTCRFVVQRKRYLVSATLFRVANSLVPLFLEFGKTSIGSSGVWRMQAGADTPPLGEIMRKLVLIIAICFIASACASVSVTDEKTTGTVFGKATVAVECTEDADTQDKTCKTSAEGQGITENAVEIIGKFFDTLVSIPGGILRTAGGALP